MDKSTHILNLADRCVKCGLCLPQCPTYGLAANENESPRGRISLIQGWLTGQLTPSETLTQHLDHCLLCRRCERICPSQVAYGEIMDQSRALLKIEKKIPFSINHAVTHYVLKILIKEKVARPFIRLLRLLQKIKLITLVEKTGLLRLLSLQRLSSFLPPLNKPVQPKEFYQSQASTQQGAIALFTGCLSNNLDANTVTASINLLTNLGFDVYVPKQQTCCGALHTHEGDTVKANELAEKNRTVFNQLNITTVVSIVNGCSSQLREYTQQNKDDSFSYCVKDILEFLNEVKWPDSIRFKPYNKTAALHIPCSLQNMLKAEEQLFALLEKIPGINFPAELVYNKCCGAAGSYFLQQPDFSQQLQTKALNHLTQWRPDIIISSNIGCTLQLKAGIKQQKQQIEVMHPILFLEQQLESL